MNSMREQTTQLQEKKLSDSELGLGVEMAKRTSEKRKWRQILAFILMVYRRSDLGIRRRFQEPALDLRNCVFVFFQVLDAFPFWMSQEVFEVLFVRRFVGA